MNEHTDTRVTDYALGELDEAARREMELQWAGDPTGRAEADEIAKLGGLLRAALPLQADGREPAATVEPVTRVLRQDRAKRRSAIWAVAASIMVLATGVAGVAFFQASGQFRRGSSIAMIDEHEAATLAMPSSRRDAGRVRVDVDSVNEFTKHGASFAAAVPEGTFGDALQSASGYGDASPVADPAEGFKKQGLGRLVLSGDNTYRGTPSTNDPLFSQIPSVTTRNFVRGSSGSQPQPVISGGHRTDADPTRFATSQVPKELNDLQFALMLEYEQLSQGYGPRHPKLEELAKKIAVLQQEIDRHLSAPPPQAFNTEAYDAIVENAFLKTADAPLSTFSIDVDTASYSNVRRMLNAGQLPPRGAVRLEEFINYFTYDYPRPTGDDPFAVTTEAARCPWNGDHVLVRVGLKGKEIHRNERPATNLVFLVDVSGSMSDANKLPLVRESLKLLVNELGDSDRVAMVVYAGRSGLVLPSTGGDRKQTILEAIDRLSSGGSTNGASGITLAYQTAVDNFIVGGVNRVVLATDGDFNVGVTNQSELVNLIEAKAKSGVFFSALGYGMGNLKDSTLEKLADKGNGNYAYIDTIDEARKVLVEQMSGTLVTIAKDVKVQIEFNPARVAAYRLLGYENRILAAQDFNDDKKDAGEIGAGHTVTALYELIPAGPAAAKETKQLPTIDELKYQQPKQGKELTAAAKSDELLTLKLRYKQPDGDVSKLIERPLADDVRSYGQASGDFKFAASAAAFGMLLRHSQYAGSATYDAVLELAQEGIGQDKGGYRNEFIELVRKARDLTKAAASR